MRTQQRLAEGRAKPIDTIVQNLYFPDDLDAEAADPYSITRELTLPQLQELRRDVQNYQASRLLSKIEAEPCVLGGFVSPQCPGR